ncbi:MAG: hypothetical protein MUF40_03770 [Gemmatimonadaceae bacterium]|nr:hypothetical protein [Gemmatimonadaceae bacterium]
MAAAAALLAACDDPFAPRPRFETVATSFVVAPLNTPLAGVPTVWRMGDLVAFRLDAIGRDFDLAFERDAGTAIRVIPSARVIGGLAGLAGTSAPRVGILKVAGSYEALAIAPERGYVVDSTQVVALGETFAVRSESSHCAVDPNGRREVFAKLVVDSVSAAGLVHLRTTVVRSCGYRSFNPGLPTN